MKKFLIILVLLVFQTGSYAADFFGHGKAEFYRENYVSAQKLFLQELQKNPENYACRYYLAHTYVYTDDIFKAKQEYGKIITFAPDKTLQKLAMKSMSNLNKAGKTSEKKQTEADNYFDLIKLNGQYVRWREFPLTVYVSPSDYSTLIKSAFTTWQKVTGGFVKFNFTGNVNSAQIVVKMTDNLANSGNEAFVTGNATVKVKNNIIYYSEIELLRKNPQTKEQLSDEIIFTTALHEIGHALGLQGHSNDNNDVMSAVNPENAKMLTKRDLATLYKLYR